MIRRPVSPRPRRRAASAGDPVIGTLELSLHFEGLAHPTRIAILERLAAAVEMRVSELAEICKVSQPRMSWHLRILRRSGLIATRREGREVFCRLDRASIAGHLRSFVRLLDLNGTADTVDLQPVTGNPADGPRGPGGAAPAATLRGPAPRRNESVGESPRLGGKAAGLGPTATLRGAGPPPNEVEK